MNSIVKEKQYISSVVGVPYENLSQSYLQKAVALSTQSVITFPVQAAQVASPLVTDQLLNLNDEFVLTHYTVFLRSIASDSPSNTQLLNALPFTYFDSNTFTGTNSVNVGAIYNGTLTFTIDRKDFIPAWPARAFYRVPTTQTAANAYFTASGIKTTNGFDNGLYGFYQTEPVKITGRQTLDISIDLGASVAMDDSSVTNYAVLELRGYLVVNAKN
jgi:hypothetical protein